MELNFISIIIPVYNREYLLEETLNSIKDQSYSNWECILVDDGSTDASWNILTTYAKKDSRFKPLKRPKNLKKGANSCRNFGFQKSEGDWVNWFDSDDIMHPDFLTYKVQSITNNIDVIISKTCIFRGSISNIVHYEERTKHSENLIDDFVSLEVSWYLPDPMWRSDFLKDKKLFSLDLKMGQDRDFHTRMLLEKPRVKFIDHYLTYYRRHQKSITDTNKISEILTFVESLDKRIAILKKHKISNKAKISLLKLQVRNYRILYKQKGSFAKFFKVFKTLFVWDFRYFIYLFKFLIASVTFNLFNKGYFILK